VTESSKPWPGSVPVALPLPERAAVPDTGQHKGPRRQLLTVVSITALTAAGVLLSLVNGVATARILAPSDRGLLSITLTTTGILGMISSLGTNVSVRVLLPRRQTSVRRYTHVSIRLIPLAIGTTFAFFLGYALLFQPDFLDPLLLLCVAWLGLSMYASSQITDLFNARGSVVLSAFLQMLGFGFASFGVAFCALTGASLTGVVIAYAAGFTLRVLCGVFIARKYISDNSTGDAVSLVSSGIRLMGLNLGQVVTYRSDQLLLGAFRDSATVGAFAIAATPAGLPQLFSNAVGQLIFHKTASGALTRLALAGWAVLVFITTALFSLLLYVSAPWLIPFVFGPGYDDAVPLLRILVVAETALAPYLVLSRAAAGLRQTAVASSSGILGAVLMLCSLLVLIPLYGSVGAAWASVLTYTIMSIYVTVMVLHPRRRGHLLP